jgi:hypothetical protein
MKQVISTLPSSCENVSPRKKRVKPDCKDCQQESLSWRQKTTEIWIQLTLHSPPPTPLLPPPTLSAGESKVNRRVGLPRSFTRSSLEARNSLPLFLVAFSTLPFYIAMVEPPVSYLEALVPAAACEIAIIFRSAGCACLARRVLSLRLPRPSYVTLSFLPLLL